MSFTEKLTNLNHYDSLIQVFLNCVYFISLLGVAALNHWIYVVGGYDGSQQLDSVERFDTENGIWESVSSIKVARSALSLTVLDGKLYAMGTLLLHSLTQIFYW